MRCLRSLWSVSGRFAVAIAQGGKFRKGVVGNRGQLAEGAVSSPRRRFTIPRFVNVNRRFMQPGRAATVRLDLTPFNVVGQTLAFVGQQGIATTDLPQLLDFGKQFRAAIEELARSASCDRSTANRARDSSSATAPR